MTPASPGSALLALAERVEAASADQQRECLEAAFSAIYPGLPLPHCRADVWPPVLRDFNRLLDAGAPLDAAMSLVPEGATWALWESGAYAVVVPSSEDPDEEVAQSGSGATPALALLAACLRARAQKADHG